jgi:hypothetical protein
MTGWLDYFVTGLEIEMIEVCERGGQVIRRDIPVLQHALNRRKAKAIGYLMQNTKLTLQEFEALCQEVNHLSLQRDLKVMMDKHLISSEG